MALRGRGAESVRSKVEGVTTAGVRVCLRHVFGRRLRARIAKHRLPLTGRVSAVTRAANDWRVAPVCGAVLDF